MKYRRSARDVVRKLENWWPWHFWGDDDDDEEKVDMDLNPVLLVPGIGGSILHAVDQNGRFKERIWVRLFEADHEFRTKLYSFYNPTTGKTNSLDEKTKIVIPDDRHGLYSCDILDPNVFLRLDSVYYFHDLIEQMKGWGYKEGFTLFGFGYDFRQSNRLSDHMEGLQKKLETIFEASGGKKVDIVSHSMGGLLVKSFLALHHEIFEKYVHSWIAVTAPFEGAPGFIMDSLLTGIEFVKGWQRELFVAKWSMHQLLIECPSIYELMAQPHFNWSVPPELRIWRKHSEENGNEKVLMEAFGPDKHIDVMSAALQDNTLTFNGLEIPLPLNMDIVKWATETKRILQTAKLPEGVKFYNLFGTSIDTPFHACYGSKKTPLAKIAQILNTEADFFCVDGDGTVPCESAMADGLDAEERLGIPGDHRGILMDERFFRIMKHWLKAGDPDPYYNPNTDFVILPPKEFEIEEQQEETVSLAGSFLDMDDCTGASQQGEYVATISTGSGSSGDIRAEAHAHVKMHHKSDNKAESHFDVSTIGVAEGPDKKETKAALDMAMAAAVEEAKAANTDRRRIVSDKVCYWKK
ncbi:unnamed protein product [Sphagnum jensenii]|uniref:Uncharacterized protein n=1 Tax=Sphagnum jensenii TaxID=128206 RepID=A0ABP0W4E1_9BRYO